MKSVKPGRGPSMMGAIGSLGAVAFGLIWTFIAYRISPLFSLFGVIFVIIGIAQFLYNLHNTKAKDRFSMMDITDSREESDPLDGRFGSPDDTPTGEDKAREGYCPYCGERIRSDYRFCPKCGKRVE